MCERGKLNVARYLNILRNAMKMHLKVIIHVPKRLLSSMVWSVNNKTNGVFQQSRVELSWFTSTASLHILTRTKRWFYIDKMRFNAALTRAKLEGIILYHQIMVSTVSQFLEELSVVRAAQSWFLDGKFLAYFQKRSNCMYVFADCEIVFK